MHANDDVSVTLFSTVNVDDDIRAVDDYSESLVSTVNVGGDIYDSGHASPPSIFNMPPVDFDSSDPSSYKNRADVIYSSATGTYPLSITGNADTADELSGVINACSAGEYVSDLNNDGTLVCGNT